MVSVSKEPKWNFRTDAANPNASRGQAANVDDGQGQVWASGRGGDWSTCDSSYFTCRGAAAQLLPFTAVWEGVCQFSSGEIGKLDLYFKYPYVKYSWCNNTHAYVCAYTLAQVWNLWHSEFFESLVCNRAFFLKTTQHLGQSPCCATLFLPWPSIQWHRSAQFQFTFI